MNRRNVVRAGLVGGAATLVGVADGTAALAADSRGRRGRIREYWIQAESFWHNVVPSGHDDMMDMKYKASDTSFWALRFRAYAPNWGHPLPGNDEIGPNTGIPGPTIRAEVGDTIVVHFRNHDSHYKFPHSMHPHGVRYDTANDGGYIASDPRPGTAVEYGATHTYTWQCTPDSVGTWPYHDHSVAQNPGAKTAAKPAMSKPATTKPATTKPATTKPAMSMGGDAIMEINAELGLIGVLAITDRHTPRVDREFILAFHDLYAADVPAIADDLDCFNGGSFLGNTPTFTARVGEKVRWRIIALGNEFHVFHLHGHRWWNGVRYVDSEIVGPSTSLEVSYVEDNPGDWLYHCHVNEHMQGGMAGWYQVR